MVRDFRTMGAPLDGCYQRGIANAPVYETLPQKMWMSPDQVERFREG